MSNVVRKCDECGFVDHTGKSAACPADGNKFVFFCVDHKEWLDDSGACRLCEERARFEKERHQWESRLRQARERGDLATALSVAQQLVKRDPSRNEYKTAQVSLEHAQQAINDCRGITVPIERWRDVQRAKELVADAQAALRVAELPEDLIERMVHLVEQAADELEGDELRKQQMFAAIRPAATATLSAVLLWALSHCVAVAVAYMVGGGQPDRPAYIWTANSLRVLGAVLLICLIARESWGISFLATGAITACLAGVILLFVSAIGQYWLGMVVFSVAAGGLTWLFEAGMDPDAVKKDSIRVAFREYLDVARGLLSPTLSLVAGVGAVVLFLAAPCLAVPQPVVKHSPFADSTDSVSEAVASAAPASPARVSVEIARVEPASPEVGKELTVYLSGESSASDSQRFQHRTDPDGDWEDMSGSSLVTQVEKPGPLVLYFRCIDGEENASEPLTADWWVQPATPDDELDSSTGSEPERIDDTPPIDRATVKVPQIQIHLGPDQPTAGGALKVFLDSLTSNLTYQYRVVPSEDWQDAARGTVVIPDLVAGSLTVQFRGIDARGNESEVRTKTFKVNEPPLAGLKINKFKAEPTEPLITSDLRIQLECNRQSNLAYYYRYDYEVSPQMEWQQDTDGMFRIPSVEEGKLYLQYGAKDLRHGDHTGVQKRQWDVERHRFQVTGLSRDGGDILAHVFDRRHRRKSTVGKSDALAEYTVVHVSLSRRRLMIRGADDRLIGVPMPVDLVHAIVDEMRAAARDEARGGGSHVFSRGFGER